MCHEFGTFGERRVSISSGAAAAMSATLETVPVCEGFECVMCCCKLFEYYVRSAGTKDGTFSILLDRRC